MQLGGNPRALVVPTGGGLARESNQECDQDDTPHRGCAQP